MRTPPPPQGRLRRCWRLLCRRDRGVAALEFALTVPVLIFLMFGMYDLSMGWMTWRRLETSATAVGQIATMFAVQADTSNWLTVVQAWQAGTAINAAMPETLASDANYTVVVSEVYFEQGGGCPANPDGTPGYCIAKVLWSKVVIGNGITALSTRPCGQQTAIADTAPPTQTGLPNSVFQANPVLVVDVAYTFTPLFLVNLFGKFPFRWMAYFPSRSGVDVSAQLIGYGDGQNAQGKKTPDALSYCQPLPAIVTSSL